MKEAMGHFMKLTQSERERLWEEQRQKSEWIWQGRLEHARKQGLTEGYKQGAGREKVEVALKMLKRQMPLSAISELTGLSEEELKQLKNK